MVPLFPWRPRTEREHAENKAENKRQFTYKRKKRLREAFQVVIVEELLVRPFP